MNNFNDPYKPPEDDIDFKELFLILWNQKFKIITVSFLSAVLGVYMALDIPNTYTSRAILAGTASSGSNFSQLAGKFGGLASMVGVTMPQASADPVSQGIERMKSLDFFEHLVTKHNLYIGLQATSGWDRETNTLIINPQMYDVKNDKWVSEQLFAVDGKPSLQSAHLAFRSKFGASVIPESQFVRLTFTHYSPNFAKEILDLIILESNNLAKYEDINVAEQSIKFLQNEANKTQLSDLRFAINSLIQKQVETIAMANASPEYLLKTLTAPYAPQLKTGPDRKVIVIIYALIGFTLLSSFYLIKHYFFNSKED